MKRTHPPLHLPGSPLIYVVAQVNISAVMAIERYVPEIQERLRKNGFPGYSNFQTPEVAFEGLGARAVISSLARHEFQNKQGRTGIVLSSKFITVHTNEYSTFDDFRAIISNALNTIHSVASLQLHERIGLRYLDLIEFSGDETAGDYLVPQLLGYDEGKIGASEGRFGFQFEGNTSVGRLTARKYPPQLSVFPPDLAGVSLNYSHRTLAPTGRAALLDLDHAANSKGDFIVEDIMDVLDALHDVLDITFRASVTSGALEKWGHQDAARKRT